MSKISQLLLIIIFALFTISLTATAKAQTASFGPIELEESANVASQADLKITVHTQNPDGWFYFDSRKDGGCPMRLRPGPCIGEQLLPANADSSVNDGKTHIEITEAVRLFNGVPDDSASLYFKPDGDPNKTTSGVWDIKVGDKTGWVTYGWQKTISTPSIEVNPTQITKADKLYIDVSLPRPLASQYSLKINRYNSIEPLYTITFLCKPEQGTCQASGLGNNLDLTSPIEHKFEIDGSLQYLFPGSAYQVTLTSPSLPENTKITKTFVIVDPNSSQPPPVAATISTIGDINPDEKKSVIIPGLNANTKYVLGVEKKMLAVYLPGQDPYTTLAATCFSSDSDGQISTDLGPFNTPGFYRLKVFKSDDSCITKGKEIVSQEFSVGGPTSQSCCVGQTPVYIRNEDKCQQNLSIGPIGQGIKGDTECKKTGTFCEPESLQCFKTKTQVMQGKICKEPKPGSDFDPTANPPVGTDRYAVCTSGGGKTIPGCGIPDANGIPDPRGPGIPTAIGCIHTNPPELVKDFLGFTIGIGGGLAFLMMLLGAFQMLTSAGNPETLATGRSRITSAIIGLLFVIFAILLLKIIGVDILNLPGFK